MLLGYRTYLKPKGVGENSMFGKAELDKTVKSIVCRSPDGMVKAELPEPQCPNCKPSRLGRTVDTQRSLKPDRGR
jgi:hypothetical protein